MVALAPHRLTLYCPHTWRRRGPKGCGMKRFGVTRDEQNDLSGWRHWWKPAFVRELTRTFVNLGVYWHLCSRGPEPVWGTCDSYQRSRTPAALRNPLPTLATLVFFTATLYLKRPCGRNRALLVSLQLTPRAFWHGLVLRAAATRGLPPLCPRSSQDRPGKFRPRRHRPF